MPIKDLDRAFEEYAKSKGKDTRLGLGLNKKIQKNYAKKDPIKSIEGITDKLYKIMKFGGNMLFSDLDYMQSPDMANDTYEEFGTHDWCVIFYRECLISYLEQCGCGLPFNFSNEELSSYTLKSILDNVYTESTLTNTSTKFFNEIIREYRASRKNDPKTFCDEFNKKYFYLVSSPNEDFDRLAGRYRIDISKVGDYFIKVPKNFKDKDNTIYNIASSLCVYFQKNMLEFYEMFSEKIESLFEELASSTNKACADAMNEGDEYPDKTRELVVEIVREQ